MRRLTASRSSAGTSLRTPSEARPAAWRPTTVPRSRAAARECAARLMAPGSALAVPRLAHAALKPFQPSSMYSGAFGLARNLLLAGVGRPEEWELAKGDPVAFMLRTVERASAGFNRKAIDGVAHVDILFGTSPYISSWHETEYENSDRVFLAVEATHISIVYLRPTLDLLAKAHPRLPATFYRMLLEGVARGSYAMTNPPARRSTSGEWSRMRRPRRAAKRVWRSRRASRRPKSRGWGNGLSRLPPAKIEADHRGLESCRPGASHL